MLERNVCITNPTGLHARPAIKLAQLAAGFKADVRLRVKDDGSWVRARSTAQVMKLKARANSTLQFRAEGDDASQAIAALIAFVQRNFDEEPEPRATPDFAGTYLSPLKIPARTRVEESSNVLAATVASQGLAWGNLYPLTVEEGQTQRAQGSPEHEQKVLQHAITAAIDDLRNLATQSDALAAEIMGVQIALLQDSEFITPVLQDIAAGIGADQAWQRLLGAEIDAYRTTGNAYFRGRATDLRDLNERVLSHLRGYGRSTQQIPDQAIILVQELTPSGFLELDWTRLAGLVMGAGSKTSHVAMLARARGVPALVELQTAMDAIPEGTEAILDGERGHLVLRPNSQQRQRYADRMAVRTARAREARRRLLQPGRTRAGVPIHVYINVDDPALLVGVVPEHCDGIGLTRTEFLFHGHSGLPDEHTQYRAYCQLLDWAKGRPVTIRTLDAGGDKPITDLTPSDEVNPFLGVRGLRLSLARPEVFRVQLRALARAAVRGPLKVLLPMVTLPCELEQARRLLAAEIDTLRAEGTGAVMPPLGMMVEVPAAALGIAEFAADFLSIGSNDLVQYVMAAGRDCPGVAGLHDPLHPAVLELIERVAHHGERAGIEVSVCGEMAADPKCLAALLEAGVRAVSVPPARLADIKTALARCG